MSRPEGSLSDYNVFVILESELFYQERGFKTDGNLNLDHDLRLSLQYGGIADSFPPRPTRYESLKLSNSWFLKKPYRSKEWIDDGHSSLIASNWWTCDKEVKAYVEIVARIVNNHRDEAIKIKRDAERLIQNARSNPSFQAKVKRKNGWVDGFYGVRLENVPSSALPYFQSYLKSRTTPCDSALPYGQQSTFASGTTSRESENIIGLPTKKSSHTTDEANLKRKAEATDLKALYEKAFGSLPQNNTPIAVKKGATISAMSTSEHGHITGKRVRSNIKADSSTMEEKEEVRCKKDATIRHNENKSIEVCNEKGRGNISQPFENIGDGSSSNKRKVD